MGSAEAEAAIRPRRADLQQHYVAADATLSQQWLEIGIVRSDHVHRAGRSERTSARGDACGNEIHPVSVFGPEVVGQHRA